MIDLRGYIDERGNKRFAVLLLGGGTKKRQQRDIATAYERWAEYKRRKKQETQ